MGTDIHSIAQIKTNTGWQTVKTCINGDRRDYEFFSLLAGVRGSYLPIKEPKGLPELFIAENNIHIFHVGLDDKDVKTFYMGYHTHSYYSLKELKKYLKNAIYRVDDVAHKSLEDLVKVLKKIKKKHGLKNKEVRFVFGFDS